MILLVFHNLKKISHFLIVKFTIRCEENISSLRRHISIKLSTSFWGKMKDFEIENLIFDETLYL